MDTDTEPDTDVVVHDQKDKRVSPLAVEAGLQELLTGSKKTAVLGVGITSVAGLYIYLLVNGYMSWTGSTGILPFIVAGGLVLGRSVTRARAARRMMQRLGDRVTFSLHGRTLTCEGDGRTETLTLMYREKLLLEAGGIPTAKVRR